MNEPAINLLSDLIKVNRARTQLYEKAASNFDNSEVMVKSLFYQIADESHELRERLQDKVFSLGGNSADEPTESFVVHQEFQKLFKELGKEDDKKAIFSACLSCEAASLAAYEKAIDHTAGFPDEIKHMIRNQQHLIKMSHDLIVQQADYHKE